MKRTPVIKRQKRYYTTLEAIRSAVDCLVGQQGFKNVGIRDICSEAGIALGTFYNYFSSKNDLLQDRYIRTNAFVDQVYKQRLADMNELDGLKLLVKEMTGYAQSRVLGVLIVYCKAQMEEYHKWTTREPDAFIIATEELVEKGQQGGTINTLRTKGEVSKFLWCYLNGISSSCCMSNGKFLDDGMALKEILLWIDTLRV